MDAKQAANCDSTFECRCCGNYFRGTLLSAHFAGWFDISNIDGPSLCCPECAHEKNHAAFTERWNSEGYEDACLNPIVTSGLTKGADPLP